MLTTELKPKGKSLIPSLENYTQASRKSFSSGLEQEVGNVPASSGGT